MNTVPPWSCWYIGQSFKHPECCCLWLWNCNIQKMLTRTSKKVSTDCSHALDGVHDPGNTGYIYFSKTKPLNITVFIHWLPIVFRNSIYGIIGTTHNYGFHLKWLPAVARWEKLHFSLYGYSKRHGLAISYNNNDNTCLLCIYSLKLE